MNALKPESPERLSSSLRCAVRSSVVHLVFGRLAVVAVSAFVLAVGASLSLARQGLDRAIASRFVAGVVRLPDGNTVTFVVANGKPLQIANGSEGYAYAFTPIVAEFREDQVTWVSHEIGNESLGFLASPRYTAVGLIERFELPGGDFDIQVLAVTDVVDADQECAAASVAASDTCCVTCGDWTVCGTKVDLWCGSCRVAAKAAKLSRREGVD